MAATASPNGLRAVNLIGGLPFAGSTRSFAIDPAGYASNIFNGFVVKIHTDGYINVVTEDGSTGSPFPAGTIGVFVGCSYTNSMGQTVFGQYYPTGSLNGVAYVIDDDRAVFQVQANGAVGQTSLGQNVLFANSQSTSTGSTATGNSNVAVSLTAQAGTAAFRIVGFVNSTTSTAVSYTHLTLPTTERV